MNDLRQEHLCLPQEVVAPLPADVRRQAVSYLRGGMRCVCYCGYSWCRLFCGCDSDVMGNAELTDGEWVWPEGLAHYVEEHGVTLPDEFIQRAVRLRTPPVVRGLPLGSKELMNAMSLDYWSAWCNTHRSGPLCKHLRRARAEAEKVVAATFRRWCEEDVAKYGLADHLCSVPGCDRKAVARKRLCCVHRIADFAYQELEARCYELKREHVLM